MSAEMEGFLLEKPKLAGGPKVKPLQEIDSHAEEGHDGGAVADGDDR